jgi:hypothetical protein
MQHGRGGAGDMRVKSSCMYVFNFFRDAILISYTAGLLLFVKIFTKVD